jgi:hypothetical protein
LLILGGTLAVLLLLGIGSFFVYRVIANQAKTPQPTAPVVQSPQPAQTAAGETSDVKVNVAKLVAMGNESLANKQYDPATVYFQQALNLDPQSAEAREGLQNVHTAKASKAPDIPPVNAATDVAKPAPVVAKPKPVKAAPVHVPRGTMFETLISSPAPVYPPVAKASHIQGSVTLHAIISKTGTVKRAGANQWPEDLPRERTRSCSALALQTLPRE